MKVAGFYTVIMQSFIFSQNFLTPPPPPTPGEIDPHPITQPIDDLLQ